MDTKRFQSSEYRHQINAARNYQRRARPKPTTTPGKFLHFVGLGRIINRILAVLVLAGLIYLSYFAKFLVLKDPEIIGTDQQATSEVLDAFHSYTKQFSYLLPQRNILYFNEKRFAEYLTSSNYKIASVKEIRKKLPNSIKIVADQRVPAYSVQARGQWFILNSDGNLSYKTDETKAGEYPKIIDVADEEIREGETFIPSQEFQFLESMRNNFESKTAVPVDHYEIPGRGSDELVVYTKKGFKVKFNSKSDPNAYLDRFLKLWSSMTPDQQNALTYADLRFDLNAYACFRGAACN